MNELPDSIQALDDAVLGLAQTLVGISPILDGFLVVVGQWFIYLVPILLLAAWFLQRGRVDAVKRRVELVLFTVAGTVGWQIISRIVKAIYFRPRPTAAGADVQELFFHRPDEAFPSDHAALLFGFATYVYLRGWSRVGHWLLLIALAVSATRIITGTHWLTDILGGLIIGLVSAWIVFVFDRPLRKSIVTPLVTWLGKIGL